MRDRAVAIVLARGGSKGLARKNVLPVAGRPCIEWTIRAARDAGSVGWVVLSTDDEEIASIGAKLGAQVVERPAALARDDARVDDAARDAHERARGLLGDALNGAPIVILYGNVPVRPAGLIDRAMARLTETGCDSVQSYAPVGKHHPWWTARVDDATGRVRPWDGEVLNHGVFRRQDLPAAYVPDGGVIALRREALFGEIPGVPPGPHAFFGRDRRAVLTGEGEVIDIDTRVDLLVADAILRERAGEGGS